MVACSFHILHKISSINGALSMSECKELCHFLVYIVTYILFYGFLSIRY